jgi:eukaryotic-like serine/threonine-protein kinase
MATVYRARHKFSDRPVAIKIMNPMLATDAKVVERFRREAKHAARLAHPNIIEIFEQGEMEDGTIYIVLELLLGASLAALIEAGPIPIDRALSIMIQCARGMARAHDLDVIHRDLKPDNIFICKRDDGTDLVKLLDFGIARSLHDGRLTGIGELFGTPQYMSPGRIRGNDTTRADDLYAAGIVFFEMVTGRLPFEASDIGTCFIKHLSEKPKAPSTLQPNMPPALSDLILQLLAKDEKGRPVDAHALEADLLLLSSERALAVPSVSEERIAFLTPPTTLREVPSAAWTARLNLTEALLTRAYGEPDKAPSETVSQYLRLSESTRNLKALRAQALEEERALSLIEHQGRELRQRIGFAVHALGQDTSKAKAELREAESKCDAMQQRDAAAQAAFKVDYRQLMLLEGRFAFASPTQALADAYRHAGELIEAWVRLRSELAQAQEEVACKVRAAADLDYQTEELRTALLKQEEAVECERAEAALALEHTERRTLALEAEMQSALHALLSPLRAKPEFASMLGNLEATDKRNDGKLLSLG